MPTADKELKPQPLPLDSNRTLITSHIAPVEYKLSQGARLLRSPSYFHSEH
jgi:hypothetical protein